MERVLVILSMVTFMFSCGNEDKSDGRYVASAPAGENYTSVNREGTTVLPNGRLITPMGRQITVAPHPFGLTLGPDGQTIITANSGVGPFSISILTDFNSPNFIVRQIPESG